MELFDAFLSESKLTVLPQVCAARTSRSIDPGGRFHVLITLEVTLMTWSDGQFQRLIGSSERSLLWASNVSSHCKRPILLGSVNK